MGRTKCLAVAMVLATSMPTGAWIGSAHDILTVAAVQALPDEAPGFFKANHRGIAHAVYDPDVSKNRGAPILRRAERPEHYLDLELLEGHDPPPDRFSFISLCAKIGKKPEHVGFLPYAVTEWTERLAVAFAEYRQWPDNSHIRNKCLIYAGFLAHYAQDMCQPLHLTIHFDGRVQADGNKEHKGIHMNVDALPHFLKMDAYALSDGLEVVAVDSLVVTVMARLNDGFARVDDVYALAAFLPAFGTQEWAEHDGVKDFAWDRARASVQFTATLFLTAWRRSADIRIPDWLDRGEGK